MQSMALAKIRPVLGLQPEEASGDCPEKAPASKAADSAQFKNILSVAVSQEQRLGQHGAVRRGAGYDMSDPFMVATSEMDFAGGKRKPLEFVQLNVSGLPCQVIGEASVVAAYLGMVKDESNKVKKPQECWMRFPDGTVKKLLRSRLLPLPTQLPRLNDWAVVVDLHGELERYNGFRGLCGLNAGQDAFWVLFEPNAGGNKSPKPPLEMIPRKNLVALPTSPPGALETQWEAKLRALPSIGHLVDDPGQPGQLEALKDKDDEENEDEEAFTEEEGEEERPEVGDLVTLLPDNKQMGILKALEGTRAEVKLLPSMAPDSLFAPRVDGCALSLLTKSSQEEAEEVALCNICGKANPEEHHPHQVSGSAFAEGSRGRLVLSSMPSQREAESQSKGGAKVQGRSENESEGKGEGEACSKSQNESKGSEGLHRQARQSIVQIDADSAVGPRRAAQPAI